MPKLKKDQAKILKNLKKLNKKLKIPSQSFKVDKEGNLIGLILISKQLKLLPESIGKLSSLKILNVRFL